MAHGIEIVDNEYNKVRSPAESLVVSNTVDIVDVTTTASSGSIRYHYDENISSCEFIVFLGVGTFMGVSKYDKIARAIVAGKPVVVVIADHNPGNFFKTLPMKYSLLLKEVTSQLGDLIPICNDDPNSNKNQEMEKTLVIGGHSASGQAAMEAWQMNLVQDSSIVPVGFIGLDPYRISARTVSGFDLPGLNWGFTETTCLVEVDLAAKGAYHATPRNARVLYTIQNDGPSSDITHCIFVDDGCGSKPLSCPGSELHSPILYEEIAESIHRYLGALQQSIPFSQEYFDLGHVVQPEIEVYVNEDVINGDLDRLSTVASVLQS